MRNKLALIATLAILSGSAQAATYNFSNAGTGSTGDLMMGFYSSGGTGSGLEVVFDLGAPTSTTLAPAAYSLNLSSVLSFDRSFITKAVSIADVVVKLLINHTPSVLGLFCR